MEMQPKESELPPPPEYSGPGYPAAQPLYPPAQSQYPPGLAVSGQPVPHGAFPVPGQHSAPASPPIIWMPVPPAVPKCPPGLECLSQIDQLSVEQQIELMEMISGYETCNRYEVKNPLGQWLYFAAEENDDFTLNMYGALRPFTIKLFNSTNQPVIQLSRSFQCSICCCPCVCCLQELEVQAPPGTIIGYVKQKWHPCKPRFSLQNEAREDILKMSGPCVPCRCFEDILFQVKALDEIAVLGTISRKWTGMAREAATDASIFNVTFPADLDIKMKAIVIGACFLLDFMYFERQGNRNKQNRRTGVHGAPRTYGHRRR
ncbi:phospholipid scramblase 1-like isoform X2 [Varanus komodoensis]|uniref:Phospholipid scramblase n=2 Tax=Varanus komodoensis TaxID=61221 RepID=A0A8D2LMI0_VARKO|nr:phospholipid scramblase 1-like isoform X2 [Varanus komodoensis]XP_044288632.1 phospholipid scramblase 1-like isoform X2 [Varanus komodoensis]XP_044288633.1 phospholipid scramblase 1-like isoform X2 [Varanus komodoensis]